MWIQRIRLSGSIHRGNSGNSGNSGNGRVGEEVKGGVVGGKRVVGSEIQRRKAKKSRRGRVDPIRRSEMLMVQNARGERSDG